MNVRVLADQDGRLIWASPAPPDACHYMDAAREFGVINALLTAGVR